jgi:superfamily II DNA or RNA helicase
MLRDVPFKAVYKSDQDSILEDFYFPTLKVASSYDRAVGYFSASTLSYAAQALSAFIQRGGNIRLILGAFADERDIDAVSKGLNLKEIAEKVGAEFLEQTDNITDQLFQHRFEALAWLVAHGRLEIKVALRPKGMYHDKIGIITDDTGDALIFSGSANESAHALLPTHNYESIDVFPSWKPELEPYFKPHKESFDRLWENQSRGTVVIDVPTAIREKLLSVASGLSQAPDPAIEEAITRRLNMREVPNQEFESGPQVPSTINGVPFQIRQHQREALKEWREKGAFVGIFDLATGAGKTITAAYAITQMAKKIPGLTVVIAVPYQSLADQWCDVLETFNITSVRCYVSQAEWFNKLQRTIHDIEMGAMNFAAIVVVNRTLQSDVFQQAMARIPRKQFLWIGDECHHHSSEGFAAILPQNAGYRIGLSATPQHYLDADRNSRLSAYYGQTVFTYTLEQAIKDEVLTPYNYYPYLVELTADEATVFVELSDEIARAFARENSKSKIGQGLTALLMKRARLVASAYNKIPALIDVLGGRRPTAHTLFYCGDGQVDAQSDHDNYRDDEGDVAFSGRQIEVVSQHLDSLGWRLSRFTSREPRREREAILKNFKMGLIDAMVAIKCLDEGIDVPACNTAYILASSRDPRQFIQRRGRILRKSPGKTIATIHDFIVILPPSTYDESGHARKLIESELRRVAEFSALALNRTEAYERLRDVLTAYDLEHVI